MRIERFVFPISAVFLIATGLFSYALAAQEVIINENLQNPSLEVRSPEPKPGEIWRDQATGMEFVFVKGGCFQMGDTFGDGVDDEKPVHEVCVADFWMGKHEVTQGLWLRLSLNNPSRYRGGSNYPVEQVNWHDIQNFIKNLKQVSDKNYRLPTEAEWEYAARSGGKREKWPGTSSESELGRYAWYSNSNGGDGPHPVGEKDPNGLGLFDMSGNVWEWCQDGYDKDYYKNSPKNNPEGPRSGISLVIRGGSWNHDSWYVRTTYRGGVSPSGRYNFVGFRLVFSAE